MRRFRISNARTLVTVLNTNSFFFSLVHFPCSRAKRASRYASTTLSLCFIFIYTLIFIHTFPSCVCRAYLSNGTKLLSRTIISPSPWVMFINLNPRTINESISMQMRRKTGDTGSPGKPDRKLSVESCALIRVRPTLPPGDTAAVPDDYFSANVKRPLAAP